MQQSAQVRAILGPCLLAAGTSAAAVTTVPDHWRPVISAFLGVLGAVSVGWVASRFLWVRPQAPVVPYTIRAFAAAAVLTGVAVWPLAGAARWATAGCAVGFTVAVLMQTPVLGRRRRSSAGGIVAVGPAGSAK